MPDDSGKCERCGESGYLGLVRNGGRRTMVCRACFNDAMEWRYPLMRPTAAELAQDREEDYTSLEIACSLAWLFAFLSLVSGVLFTFGVGLLTIARFLFSGG